MSTPLQRFVRRALPIVLALAVLSACEDAEEKLESAREVVPAAMAREDRQAALEALAGLRETVPENRDDLLALAALFVRAGEAPDALWLLEVGAERFPGDPEVQIELARAALLVQNPSLALASVRDLDEQSEFGRDALLLRAEAELALGDLDAAVVSLDVAYDLDPAHPASHLARIQLLMAEHRDEEAREATDRALAELRASDASEEDIATFGRVRAQLSISRGEYAEAERWLAGRLERAPSDIAAWQLWYAAAHAQQDPGPIGAAVEAAIEAHPTLHDLEVIRALVARLEDDEAKADGALQRFAQQSDSSLAIVPWVQSLIERGDLDGAQAALDDWMAVREPTGSVQIIACELALDRNDLDEVERCIDAYEGRPDAVQARAAFLRARLSLSKGEIREASVALTRLAPKLDVAPTQFWLGRALELQGDLEGAYRRYGLAVLRDPYWPIPVAAVAQLSAQRGRWEDAEGAAAGWVRLSPGVVDAWALLIQSRLRRLERIAPGLRAEAAETTAEVAGEARKRFPDDPRFGVWLAQALRRAGRDEAARAEIDRLAGPDAPGSDDVWVAVETARFHALGDLARGLTEARAAVDRFPDEASAHALLAEVAYGAGAVEEADRATARALERAPDEVEPLRVRCRFRVATGRFAGAVEDCRRVLSANEADPEVHFWLGTALANTGQAEGAIAVYRRAIELDPEDFRPHNNLADLLARAGRTEEALDAAQEAYRLSEGNPYVADTVATLYLERGFGSRAVSLLEDAHAAIPDVPSVRLNLARAYVAVDQRDRAEALVAAWSNTPEGSPHAGTVREILSLESARAE